MRRTRSATGALASLVAAGLLVAACGGSDDSSTGADADEQVTLSISVFGDAFPKELYAEYSKTHSNITIKENRADYATHHNNLQARLAAGSGTADIEAIEVGQIAGFIGQPDKLVNFLDEGVDTSSWTKAKIRQASTPDAKALIGLPTDTGGLAVCYRQDLFEKAGLPTDPAAVSALWPTWNDYLSTGERYVANAPKGSKWFDAASTLFTGILGNEPKTFYEEDGAVIAASNPVVKSAWDLSVRAIQQGQSAKLAQFTPEWNTGFQRGQFATITCPSWMLAYIRTNAPETKGKWNIASVPGGSGNWGGSFLAVPKQGKHVKEAVELAKWLTAPEQSVKVFTTYGNFPSAVKTWESPQVSQAKDTFFGGAPVGQIFPESLRNASAQIVGAQSGVIGTALGNGLASVEKGTAPSEAWSKTLKDIEAATGS